MLRYYLALFVALFIWGSYFVPLKYSLKTTPPSVVAFLAALMAACVFWISLRKKIIQTIRKDNLLPLMGVGLFGTFGFNILMNTGLKDTLVINASLLLVMLPVWGFIYSFVFEKANITFIKLFGCFLSIIGAIYLITQGALEKLKDFSFHKGDMLVIAATLSLIAHIACARRARNHHGSKTVTALQLTVGALLLFPLALKDGLLNHSIHLSPLVWLSIIYIGAVRSTIANTCYNYSLKKIDIITATIATNIEPFIASFFSILLLGEKLTRVHIIAGLLIISGITLTIQRNKKIAYGP